MNQQLVTILCPLDRGCLGRAEGAIDSLEAWVSSDPRPPELAKLDDLSGEGTHFMSLHAIASKSTGRAYLLFEISADGEAADALLRIVGALGDRLRAIFLLASDWSDGAELTPYLLKHRVKTGGGWFDQPGVGFIGAPGMSVGRIRAEARLAVGIADLIENPRVMGEDSALGKVEAIQRALQAGSADCLVPADDDPPWTEMSLLWLGLRSIGVFVTNFLWPVLLVDGLILVAVAARKLLHLFSAQGGQPMLLAAATFARSLLGAAVSIALISLIASLLLLLFTYWSLRAAEKTDWTDDRAADPLLNAQMFERENRCRQNHMISITVRKPGLVRAFTSRLVFWFLARAVGKVSPPGFLGSIGTIHFARWVTVPGTRDVVFLSNYDGSWESYLEDFITRAHEGLTGVWSNSVGFPRASNLIGDGATDSERFKRFARASMIPTRFWYSAYPQLTVAAIRTNREIRRGLTGAMTEDEASAFLALFGSGPRPPDKLVSSGIQSIVFGGLSFMKHSRGLVFDHLPDDPVAARAWLEALSEDIAYNDGRRLRRKAVLILGLGPRGLRRLGLPESAVASFPFAFVEGMTGPGRKQIIGDDPSDWRWGSSGADALLLVYGYSDLAVRALCRKASGAAKASGMAAPHVIRLEPFATDKSEPFGFVDGISQPVIRGTYKALRNADPIHIVEPGEFILGYPDGRGNMPPGPRLEAIHDPGNLLPLVAPAPGFGTAQVDRDRDLGFNGTFLAVREFSQDIRGFRSYCTHEAERLASDSRFPQPYVITPEFIGAKLVGRWKDGSSLARFPYLPQSTKHRVASGPTLRPVTAPAQGHVPVMNPPGLPETDEKDNDFLFGAEDPEALRCPFGAHIRRANPRDSLAPGAADEIAIVNRHRIIRVGRPLHRSEPGAPGILFMCLNGDLERQFEFIQQTWLRNPAFHGLSCEKDAIVGDGEQGACSYTIATRDGPVRLSPMIKPFVTTRGGGYFFLPGKRLVDYLARRP